MFIFSILSVIGSLNAVLELTSKIARYTINSKKALTKSNAIYPHPSNSERNRALEITLTEWEQIASIIEPRLKKDLDEIPKGSLIARADALASLAEKYAKQPHETDSNVLKEFQWHHTKLDMEPEGSMRVYLGQSEDTRILLGETFNIESKGQRIHNSTPYRQSQEEDFMSLPVFKVTMLGDSQSGKTVFMSSMYTKLREGDQGISIRAIDNDKDKVLDQIMRELIIFDNWPLTSEDIQLQYEFELLSHNRPVARIDWVDYRGGAIGQNQSEDGAAALQQRLNESHAVLWMVDMTKLEGTGINTTKARLLTNVGRLAALSRNSMANNNSSKVWIFVRTKSDTIRDDSGGVDYARACRELVEHLGDMKGIGSRHNTRAAAVAVSSVGRLSNVKDGKIEGDDPAYVQWPLILALAFLLEVELNRLGGNVLQVNAQLYQNQAGRIETFFRKLLALGGRENEVLAHNRLDELTRQLLLMGRDLKHLLEKCPSVVKFLD